MHIGRVVFVLSQPFLYSPEFLPQYFCVRFTEHTRLLFLMIFDAFIFSQLNGLALQWSWFDYIVIFFAVYVPWILAGVLFLFVLRNFKKYFKWIAGAAFSAILGGALVLVINSVFYRARPFVLRDINLLLQHLPNSSFPSFHTTTLFAAGFFLYAKKFHPKLNTRECRWGSYIFLFISLLVAVSRVIAGVHWPIDILAGILLGGFCGWVIYKIFSHRVS